MCLHSQKNILNIETTVLVKFKDEKITSELKILHILCLIEIYFLLPINDIIH